MLIFKATAGFPNLGINLNWIINPAGGELSITPIRGQFALTPRRGVFDRTLMGRMNE